MYPIRGDRVYKFTSGANEQGTFGRKRGALIRRIAPSSSLAPIFLLFNAYLNVSILLVFDTFSSCAFIFLSCTFFNPPAGRTLFFSSSFFSCNNFNLFWISLRRSWIFTFTFFEIRFLFYSPSFTAYFDLQRSSCCLPRLWR